jgi:folate-dependent phosphoribosylglycinamide formyltransferase PurN
MSEKITPIYSGKPEDFCWVGFGSGTGTNLEACAKVIPPKLIFSDKPKAKVLQREIFKDTEKLVLNGYKECGSWKAIEGNEEAEVRYRRRAIDYNKKIVAKLKEFEDKQGKPIDLIVLGGYMRIVEAPLLEAYKDKIINVHPADLSILNFSIVNSYLEQSGLEQVIRNLAEKAGVEILMMSDREYKGKSSIKAMRKYIGEDAVYDALFKKGNEYSTRSSVIIVDYGIDHGEILTMGPKVRTNFKRSRLTLPGQDKWEREQADAHQEKQKEKSDWPSLTTALELIAEGQFGLGTEKTWFNEWRAVYVGSAKMPYQGFEIER